MSVTITGRSVTAGRGSILVETNVVYLTGQTTTAVPGVIAAIDPIFRGFNFRSTLAYVTDTGNNFWAGPNVGGTFDAGIGYGWPGTSPVAMQNVSTSVDTRIAGAADLSASSTKFQVNVPSGDYTIRLGIGWNGAAGTRNCRVRVGSGSTVNVDYFDIIPSTTIANSDTADALGTIYTAANWVTSNQTIQITAPNGYIQIDGGASGGSWIRHLAIAPVATTLVSVAGQSLTSSIGTVSLGTPGGATLSGQATTLSQGTTAQSLQTTISGFGTTVAHGIIGVPQAFAVVGQGLALSGGSISFGTAKIVSISGQTVTVNQATPVSSGIDLVGSGQSATVNQSGPVQTAMDLGAFGLGMTTGIGVISAGVPGAVTLIGQPMMGSQGTLDREFPYFITGQEVTAAIANVSGVPRHDVSYDISRGFDGAFDPGGFYSSINPYSTVQQGAVTIASNVPALRSTALEAGQGALSYTVTFLMPAQPMTSGQGAAVATLEQSIAGQFVNARQAGDVYTFFPGFFEGTVENLYVPSEENVLYVPQDVTDMLVL